MKELRTLACVFSLSTLTLLFYGAFAPGGAAFAGPGVAITQPNAGALVQGNVTVSVSYRSASGVKVTDLEFWVDKARQATVKLAAPSTEGTYSFIWNTAGLAPGAHTITAVAYDAKGQPGDVAVSVYVQEQAGRTTQAPAVRLSSPANGSVVQGVVNLVANVIDSVGVKWVLFQLDNRFLFATNHPPFRYNWDTAKVPNGQHSIQVYTFDANDNRSESQPVLVMVDNPSGRTLPGERPFSTATGTTPAPAPAAPADAPAAAPQTPAIPPAPVAGPVPAGQRDTKPAATPPVGLQPTFEMSRRDIPTLPAVPSDVTRDTPGRPAASPIVARPRAASADVYPDIDIQISRADTVPGLAAPSLSATPRATARPTATTPAARAGEVMVSSVLSALRSMEFAASDRHVLTAPAATSARPAASATRPSLGSPEMDAGGNAPVALPLSPGSFRLSMPSDTLRQPEKPAVPPAITMARVDAPSVMADTHAAATPASGFVSAAARGTAPRATGAPSVDPSPLAARSVAPDSRSSAGAPSDFVPAGSRGSAPSHSGAPSVAPSRLMPELVAIVASVPTSLLRAGAQQSRSTMPAGGATATGSRDIQPASLDSGSMAPEVIAVTTDGQVASLTPMADAQRAAAPSTVGAVPSVSFGGEVVAVAPATSGRSLDPNAGGMRLTAPAAGAVSTPSLTVTTPQSGTQVATRSLSGTQAGALLEASGARLSSPAAPGRSGSPKLSVPGSTTGVVIAAVDPRTRQAVPLAMIQTHASAPAGARNQPRAARRAPADKVVVAPQKGGPVTVVYNGKPVDFGSVGPVVQDGMTLAPFRHIMEMSGGVVLWNNLIKQVKASNDGRRIEFTIGETQAVVNNQPVQMPTAPFLKQGRAIVPMSFMRDALDVVVEYDPTTGRVTIAAK